MSGRQSLGRLYLDLIRDGVNVDGCDADEHDRQVHRALVRSAMSAAQCGQQFDEWMVLVRESISRLGQQAKRKGGRQDRSDRELNLLLLDAWTTAEERITERPTMTAQDRAERITSVRQFCADADTKMTDTERAVLAAACDLAEQYGTIRPALPWRRLRELSGLGERATKSGLASLRAKGLLVLHRRGSAAGDPRRRRASVFHLPSAEVLAAHGAAVPYTPRGLTYGTPQPSVQTYGTPAQMQVTSANHKKSRRRGARRGHPDHLCQRPRRPRRPAGHPAATTGRGRSAAVPRRSHPRRGDQRPPAEAAVCMTTVDVEIQTLSRGLSAVLIPRGLTAAQEHALRERLGLTCRHGRRVRAERGSCRSCVASRTATS